MDLEKRIFVPNYSFRSDWSVNGTASDGSCVFDRERTQGSMYWAMSIIGLKDYTVLVFRIICFAVVATTIVSIVF